MIEAMQQQTTPWQVAFNNYALQDNSRADIGLGLDMGQPKIA